MKMTLQDALAELAGRSITGVQMHEDEWLFQFEGGATLNVECPWRIVSGGAIAFADTDHGQRFGRAAILDGVLKVKSDIAGKAIASATISQTADLVFTLADSTRLEVWCQSSGYESWALRLPPKNEFIAAGGGAIVTYND